MRPKKTAINKNLISDLFYLNLCFVIGYYIKFNVDFYIPIKYLLLITYSNLIWIIVTFNLKFYQINNNSIREELFINLNKVYFLHVLILGIGIVIFKGYYFSRLQLFYSFVLFYISIFLWRYIKIVTHNKLNLTPKNVVIIGSDSLSYEIKKYFDSNESIKYNFKGFLCFSNIVNFEDTYKDLLQETDEIYISVSQLDTVQLKEIIDLADQYMIRVKLLTEMVNIESKKMSIEFYDSIPVINLRNIPLDKVPNRILKRSFDIIFSILVVILILSWLYPIIAILIKLTSKGPILFKQIRTGKDNKDFWCLKFRTMRVNLDANQKQATKYDPRITIIGHFLRKTSIDELPQFINVLFGNMSVVGPRPHMIKHTEYYSQFINKYMVRHYVKPGITGLAQAKGYRGETKENKMMQKRIIADIYYIENWSFLLDIKIIIMTILTMIFNNKNAL